MTYSRKNRGDKIRQDGAKEKTKHTLHWTISNPQTLRNDKVKINPEGYEETIYIRCIKLYKPENEIKNDWCLFSLREVSQVRNLL